ncbi:putative Deubiquitination-protection protein dph1 [Seiridium cardinale]|uniref:Deubiquitination-protection protein dph1 n=1 Tax=Seiridium cardinale TaxID=138064 RepID=A0ABR2Y1V4_9PEZI
MAEPTEGSADSQVTFKVKTSGDSNHTITMAESATVLDLKAKLSAADFENIPVERQRLIYSGRVMKNEEPLSTYKIKSGNTVHLVKSAASNPTPAPASTSSQQAPPRPQVPTNMAAGTANNPLAGLTGARYAGLTGLPSADLFGPDGGMAGPMMDEEGLNRMMQDPNVLQQMNEMLNNDQFLDMMIQQNPMLRDQPNAREILRSPMFRNMMTNPEALRSAQRFGRMMRGGGAGGGQSAFPAPGVTDTTPQDGSAGNAAGNNAAQANPFDPAAWAGLQMPGSNNANPFAGLMNPFAMGGLGAPPAAGAQAGAGAQAEAGNNTQRTASPGGQGDNAANPTSPPSNPFAALFGGAQPGGAGAGAAGANNPFGLPPVSPEALRQMMELMGGGMGSSGGVGSPAPADNRPPEERYAEQLRQLNDMGFYDFDRNVAALRRSGGSVQGAIEHLLSS